MQKTHSASLRSVGENRHAISTASGRLRVQARRRGEQQRIGERPQWRGDDAAKHEPADGGSDPIEAGPVVDDERQERSERRAGKALES